LEPLIANQSLLLRREKRLIKSKRSIPQTSEDQQ
jgi:hypothetical protein